MQLRTVLGTAAALSMAALAGLGIATPALAAYGPGSDSPTVSATSVAEGDSITVSGDGFLAGSIVTLTASQGGTVYLTDKARASGGGGTAFGRSAASPGDVSFTVNLTEAGVNTITLTGRQADGTGTRVLATKVSVRAAVDSAAVDSAAAANAGSNLPGTGGVDFTPLWAGLGLLAAGTLLVTAAQSRRRILV